MNDYFQISESLYAAAANSIRSLTEHYSAMLAAGVNPEDVLQRLVRHIEQINQSTASEAEKTKAKAELLAFATSDKFSNHGWPTVSGLFGDGYVPDGWMKE